jgi:hypothetical protein
MSFGVQSSKQESHPTDMTPAAFKNLQTPFAARISQLLGFTPAQFASFGGGFSGGSGGGGATTGAPQPKDWSKLAVNYQPGGTVTAGAGSPYETMPDGSGFVLRGTSGQSVGANGGYANRAMPLSGQPGGSGSGGGGGGGTDLASLFTGDMLSGIPKYDGPLTADMSGNEKTLLDQIMKQSTGTGPMSAAQKALMDIINHNGPNVYRPDGTLAQFADTLQGASNTGAFSGAEGSPFLQKYIEAAQRPTLEGLTETLTRDLPGRFTQAGQLIQPGSSSAFDRAAAIATRGVSNAVGDIATNISYKDLADNQQREAAALGEELQRRFTGTQSNADRGLDAAKALPGVNAQQVDTLIKSLQAEALPRLIKDQGIERGMALFKERVDNLLKVLGITAGVTQPTISQTSTGKSSGFDFGLPKL